MKIEIDSKKNNPLLNRAEVYFTIHHEGEGTPDREITRGELAEKLNVKKENIVINNIKSNFGIQKSTGYAKIYSSVEKAKGWESDHILVRNKLIVKEEKKKPKEKPAEKPKEKPKTAEEPKKKEGPSQKEEKPAAEEAPKKEPIEQSKKEAKPSNESAEEKKE